ncbi:MAG: tRNA pseudouridine(38-40) synthase TruA [Chloroflexi bacterium GWB2_49_20]|nr:MAG: tRNA pseudouridine(38-40) synthase TruA [Chloroflexi bacterium GWB2_49_20]OGN76668.1 MAG: tRNA pseudouridine(38-40) synthase TruA [Chloroflexi bacterium GWC2_49_37]OGN83628.1 MAG: tRNA pseudouridine(38-40) synthase TruA [Chloroflexi bacterium GWD2_49_16]HBG74252.1 tRNA pseudouridine(38-40) synthase TruA [Anaerolineae bacterium]HCC79458.1 tRNA pseudouridine(38-40) synthase TruA [Anaerolineae bacterium]
MARYQIILTYDGTEFVGSQRQLKSRTVQSELEKALGKLKWDGKSALMAGRTDTGVHASGQVAAFDLDWKHSLEDLGNALNASLPLDMAISQVGIAREDFHPRFDATCRRYSYRLFCQPNRDPLRERFAWRVWPSVSDLHSLAEIWPGTHDFAAFGTPPRPGNSTERTVLDAKWQLVDDEWQFEIRANAFLYHMVRKIVHAQVAVGQGRITIEDLTRALEHQAALPSRLAPAHGLTLVEVSYEVLE